MRLTFLFHWCQHIFVLCLFYNMGPFRTWQRFVSLLSPVWRFAFYTSCSFNLCISHKTSAWQSCSCFLSWISLFLSPTWPRLSLPCRSLKARSSWGPRGPGTWRWMTWKTMMTISSPPRNHWRTREGWAQRKGGLGRGQLARVTS